MLALSAVPSFSPERESAMGVRENSPERESERGMDESEIN